MTNREKRCEDCSECIKKNGVMCCSDMWDKPCNDIEECSLGIELSEIEEITEKTKNVKIEHGVGRNKENTEKKPKTVKVSDEKTQIFTTILGFLTENYNVNVLKDNKLIEIELNDKKFKVDLIETRQKKS